MVPNPTIKLKISQENLIKDEIKQSLSISSVFDRVFRLLAFYLFSFIIVMPIQLFAHFLLTKEWLNNTDWRFSIVLIVFYVLTLVIVMLIHPAWREQLKILLRSYIQIENIIITLLYFALGLIIAHTFYAFYMNLASYTLYQTFPNDDHVFFEYGVSICLLLGIIGSLLVLLKVIQKVKK